MSYIKRYIEEVMVDLGKEQYDDEVRREAERRLNEGTTEVWIRYSVRHTGRIFFNQTYKSGDVIDRQWKALITDLTVHGSDRSWRIVEESDRRKIVAYDDDDVVIMTVFQLVSLITAVPDERATDGVGVGQCIKDGTHLTDCDNDGYCNYCGEQ